MVVSDGVRKHVQLIMFVALMLLIVGSILFYNAYQIHQTEKKISTLKITDGIVIVSSYNQYNETSIQNNCLNGLDSHSVCSTPTSVSSKTDITFIYEYRVEQKVYHSSNDGYCSSEPAQSLIASNPAGSTIKVYYNPAKPTEAYLNVSGCPKGDPTWGLICILSSVFCLGYVFLDEEPEVI